jgi:NADPH:quinone reductase-like Zn-dependent oxidoreductase
VGVSILKVQHVPKTGHRVKGRIYYFYNMKLIVTPKNKKQEKIVKNLLAEAAIDFTVVQEDATPYKIATKKTHSKKEKKILENLEQSVDFVNKYKKRKTKAKSIKQLLNEL